MTDRKPRGYWQQWDNVQTELQSVIDKLGHFPSDRELNNLKQYGLRYAIRYHGNYSTVQRMMGQEGKKKPKGYWKDWNNIQRELATIADQLGHFPTQRELIKIGKSSLMKGINHYNGIRAIRSRLGYEEAKEKPRGYWQNWEHVEQELQLVIQQLGHFPTLLELNSLGKSSLKTAIAKYHGNIGLVREKLGYALKRKPRGYWVDWKNIEKEFKRIIEEHGAIPKSLKAIDCHALELAIFKHHGGIETVLMRLQQEGVLLSEQEQLEQLVAQYIA